MMMRATVIAIILLLPASAAAQPLDSDGLARLEAHWPEVEVAADLAGLDVEVVAALLLHESRCQAVSGWFTDAAGPGQIRWSTWGPLLGPEGWHESDLMDLPRGIVATGRVLQSIREWWPELTTDQVLCAYSSGSQGRRWSSCAYSREVLRQARLLRQVWGPMGVRP